LGNTVSIAERKPCANADPLGFPGSHKIVIADSAFWADLAHWLRVRAHQGWSSGFGSHFPLQKPAPRGRLFRWARQRGPRGSWSHTTRATIIWCVL